MEKKVKAVDKTPVGFSWHDFSIPMWNDLFPIILSHFTLPELLKLRLVSKLFKKLIKKRTEIYDNIIIDFFKSIDKDKEQNNNKRQNSINNIFDVKNNQNLKNITLVNFDEQFNKNTAVYDFQKIRNLTIKDCNFINNTLKQFAKYLENLESLEIDSCIYPLGIDPLNVYKEYDKNWILNNKISNFLPLIEKVKQLSIIETNYESYLCLENNPNLFKHINLDKLKKLNIDLFKLSNEVFINLLKKAQNIETLFLEFSDNFKEIPECHDIKLPNIEEIFISTVSCYEYKACKDISNLNFLIEGTFKLKNLTTPLIFVDAISKSIPNITISISIFDFESKELHLKKLLTTLQFKINHHKIEKCNIIIHEGLSIEKFDYSYKYNDIDDENKLYILGSIKNNLITQETKNKINLVISKDLGKEANIINFDTFYIAKFKENILNKLGSKNKSKKLYFDIL